MKKNLCAALERALDGKPMRLPAGAEPLMEAFMALSQARSLGPVGPNPIAWEAVAAWSALMRVPLSPSHAEIIMAMDDVWMRRAYQRPPEGVKTLPPVSARPLTAELLDAVLG